MLESFANRKEGENFLLNLLPPLPDLAHAENKWMDINTMHVPFFFFFQPCTQSLETLNLGHNSVGNEGVHKLKDGLIANRSVLRLGLASTKLSCEGGHRFPLGSAAGVECCGAVVV